MENTIYDTTPIFTRYLYYKNDVVLSLILCMLKKDVEKSLFWGYELYYSGFKQEVLDILLFVYEEFYELINPIKIKIFIEKKIMEWKTDYNNHSIVATIIHNIACRPSIITNFYKKYGNSSIETNKIRYIICDYAPKKILYVIYDEKTIEKYNTIENDKFGIASYSILKKVCKYSTIKNAFAVFDYVNCYFLEPYLINISRKKLRDRYFYNWEYYAFFTPIWRDRIKNYLGTVNFELNKIVFKNEELEDLFYDQYGIEPDEQPMEITEKTVGINIDETPPIIFEDFITYKYDS